MPERHRNSPSGDSPEGAVAAPQLEVVEPKVQDSSPTLKGDARRQGSDYENEAVIILLDLLGRPRRDDREPRRGEALRRILEGYEGFRQERQERQVILTKLGVSILFFCGGIVLAMKDYQDIGFFILGCATALLGETRAGGEMREISWRSLAHVMLFGLAAAVALIFAIRLVPGDGARHVLMFLSGALSYGAVSSLRKPEPRI